MVAASQRTLTTPRAQSRLLFAILGILLLFGAVGAGPALAGAAWTKTSPGYDKYYLGVDFVDAQNGWLVGEHQIILHTSDGGVTWTQQHLNTNNYALQRVQMWSTTRGWAVGNGGASSGNGSAILATTDGTNWAPQAEPPYLGVLRDLCFVSPTEGWAVGTSSHIIHTTTGGGQWTEAHPGVPDGVDSIDFNGVDFADSQHGWAVGEDFYQLPGGDWWASVYSTSDGGASWSFSLPGRTFIPGRFNDVEFVAPSGVWACGEDTTKAYGERGMIWYSNAGSAWTRQTLPAGTDDLSAIHFVTATTGWAVGDDVILYTTNGGGLWTKESSPSNSYLGILTDVDSDDGVTAWASGFGDNLMRRGNTPTTADARPLPQSPVSGVLAPPFFVDLWSLALGARQQIIVTMTSGADSLETCLWPPGTQEVADTSAAVARSRTYDTVKRFKYVVPAGAGGTYFIEDWSTESNVASGDYTFTVDVQSPTTRVSVTPPAVSSNLKSWRDYTFYGTLKPLHFYDEQSVRVVWQKFSGGRWRTDSIMRPTNVDYAGYTRYKVAFKVMAYGSGTMRWRVQAIHLKDALHPQKASAWRYFSVSN
jgi:photosystem II stability/assembly factor-like uncharacterized protein